VDQRGEFWINWNSLDSWVEAAKAYRHDSSVPIDSELVDVWPVLLPERPGGASALQAHLDAIVEWAQSIPPKLSPDAWQRAYAVLYAGATYE
jgi:hypothetical protein